MMPGITSILLLIAMQAGIGAGAAAPLPPERSVGIDQIGDAHVAVTRETGTGGVVLIDQDGDSNMATVIQSVPSSDNRPDDGAEASVAIYQRGSGNAASVQQFGVHGMLKVATLSQDGSNNIMRLEQSGGGNRAELEQTGDGNAMDARQIGNDNTLRWTQTGSGLPDLGITQTGGQRMAISQTGPGR
ncbi:hypothetical protein [Sphingomonas sp.]|uniref:hypothetical protein n=1 Tax=Sphingomonas sp. TaxID=28214 RepID=UPI0035B35A4A